ncbi:MAG: RNase adapter RapZ [Ruminococcus sp.]|nr:RNase adapter RapZ [Ruminococcus sp.]MBQ8905250.1 RNase adapter RapZ [Ruminococcus sp.]
MQMTIVTGMSGSGKSLAMNVLEDIGYYCIDNMPPQLLLKFTELCLQSGGKLDRVAIAMDIRSAEVFTELRENLKAVKENETVDVKVLYLEAVDDVIFKRYKETRRKHPLDAMFHGSLHAAIAYEREQLNALREIASYFIDTSYLSNSQLKEQVRSIYLNRTSDSMLIQISSFGFKYGTNTEADLVFDVRCLPNPYYINDLKPLTGCDAAVRDYVMSFEQSQELLKKLKDLLEFLIPLYVQEGKSQLVIGFGCTGGKHRSVTFAELMTDYLAGKGFCVHKSHRDITKDRG